MARRWVPETSSVVATPRYLLDTDHASLFLNGDPEVAARVLAKPADDVGVTIVTAHELLAGWFSQITKHQPAERYVWAYAGFHRTLEFLKDVRIVDFTAEAVKEYARLRTTYRRLGTHDLRIAAIALICNAVIVTRNRQDFGVITGLSLEDWTVTLSS